MLRKLQVVLLNVTREVSGDNIGCIGKKQVSKDLVGFGNDGQF